MQELQGYFGKPGESLQHLQRLSGLTNKSLHQLPTRSGKPAKALQDPKAPPPRDWKCRDSTRKVKNSKQKKRHGTRRPILPGSRPIITLV